MTAATPGQAAYEAYVTFVGLPLSDWPWEDDDVNQALWDAVASTVAANLAEAYSAARKHEAAIAAQQPQPARGDMLYVTPGDGTAIGGLLAHVGVESQPAPGEVLGKRIFHLASELENEADQLRAEGVSGWISRLEVAARVRAALDEYQEPQLAPGFADDPKEETGQ